MALQQSAELRDLLLRYYQALGGQDISPVLTFMSREEGVLSIGTDREEWWTDFGTFERVVAAQMPELRGASVRFEPGDPQCYQEGTVGWCADRARLVLPDGTARQVRITAVFHQEGDGWKMVQSHASFGVPNAEAIGTDLTT